MSRPELFRACYFNINAYGHEYAPSEPFQEISSEAASDCSQNAHDFGHRLDARCQIYLVGGGAVLMTNPFHQIGRFSPGTIVLKHEQKEGLEKMIDLLKLPQFQLNKIGLAEVSKQ
ncbi:MAG: hypothetical protein MUF61_00290 [archaeon]|jgi:hypothetical protein|nr:hypothetical protein [archaeon]